MGGTALSSSPSQGHMSCSRALKCCWLCPSREAEVWWPTFPAGLGAASLGQATGTSTYSYLCQPSTQTHGSGTLPRHRALPTALFPRKSLEIISCPAPAAPGTDPGFQALLQPVDKGAGPGRTGESHWHQHRTCTTGGSQSALSAFPASHQRTTTRSGEKGRRQGPPAFPATPPGVSPSKGYPGTPEADRAPFPLAEETPSPAHTEQTSEVAFGEGVARRELPRLRRAGLREWPRSGTPCPPLVPASPDSPSR